MSNYLMLKAIHMMAAYITIGLFVGRYALMPSLGLQARLIATTLALVQIMAIFYLALTKPMLFA